MYRVLAMVALLLPMLLQAEVYRWVDEDGTVHYSDQPGPGSEEVEVDKPQTVPGGSTSGGSPARSTQDGGADEEGGRYRSLSITQPTPEATIRDNQGRLEVRVSVEPALRTADGHRLAIYLDGELKARTKDMGAVLESVPPGTHTVRAAVVDDQGEELLGTGSSTVYFRRATIKQPDNPRSAPSQPLAPRAPGTTRTAPGNQNGGSDADS